MKDEAFEEMVVQAECRDCSMTVKRTSERPALVVSVQVRDLGRVHAETHGHEVQVWTYRSYRYGRRKPVSGAPCKVDSPGNETVAAVRDIAGVEVLDGGGEDA